MEETSECGKKGGGKMEREVSMLLEGWATAKVLMNVPSFYMNEKPEGCAL